MARCFDAGLKHGIRPGFYYSVHANWFAGVTSFNLTDPAKQAAFEDKAMHQLAGTKLCEGSGHGCHDGRALSDLVVSPVVSAEIAQIFEDGGASAAEIWFDAGVRQAPAFVERVNDWVSTRLPPTATCHSCANMKDVHAVSWMGNEETVMPYPMWNANVSSRALNLLQLACCSWV